MRFGIDFDRHGSSSTAILEERFVRHPQGALNFVDWGDGKTTGIHFPVVLLFSRNF